MPHTNPSASNLEQFQSPEIQKVLDTFHKLRWRVVPVLGIISILIITIDDAEWRKYTLIFSYSTFLFFTVFSHFRPPKHISKTSVLALYGFMIVSFQALLAFCTGAIESPIFLVLPLVCFVVAILIGRSRLMFAVASVPLLMTWVFALGEVWAFLPNVNLDVFGGGHRAGHNDVLILTQAVIATILIIVTSVVGVHLRSIFDAMVMRAIDSRDEALNSHKEQIADMNALSGEIAHELKNPLTSIKGLAALVAKDLPGGNATERMNVLRQEVDRMQGIVEEFLTFSRPLTPLQKSQSDIPVLCREVLILHEGVAKRVGVAIKLHPDAVKTSTVDCDPRKIKQVLINLIQNAIDACSENGNVSINISHQAKNQCTIELEDDGPGLENAVIDRIFSAGVSTKAKGSGLGLTIAKGIAEQHGGTLQIKNRAQGGCVAILNLPIKDESNDD